METKRYPIRGALYGLLIGLMAAYFVFFRFTMFGFDSLGSVITKFVIVVLLGVVLGVLWAYVAPARRPKGPAPAALPADPEPAPPPVDTQPTPPSPTVAAPPPGAATTPPVPMEIADDDSDLQPIDDTGEQDEEQVIDDGEVRDQVTGEEENGDEETGREPPPNASPSPF